MPNSSRLAVLLTTAAVLAATLVPSVSAAADEPTPAPVVSSAPEETEAPDAVETPDGTVRLTGSFVTLADEGLDTSGSDGARFFQAEGAGFVLVDVSGVTIGDTAVAHTLEVEVPAGLDAASDDFLTDLAKVSLEHDPLVVVAAGEAQLYASMVNQTPNTSADHRVYAVLVTPTPGAAAPAANQTASKVAVAVAHADDYWKIGRAHV